MVQPGSIPGTPRSQKYWDGKEIMRNTLALMGLHHFLSEHPDAHDQAIWGRVSVDLHPNRINEYLGEYRKAMHTAPLTCGTAACSAGWTVLLNGAKPHDLDTIFEFDTNFRAQRVTSLLLRTVEYDGKLYYVPDLAAEMLGLEENVTYYLFSSMLKRDAVLTALEMLIAGKDDDAVIDYLAREADL
ncbi:hypothetical protein [Mycobacterium phage Azrael100]|nr:hypothetical protein [Mycobacterium phage Azrael100]